MTWQVAAPLKRSTRRAVPRPVVCAMAPATPVSSPTRLEESRAPSMPASLSCPRASSPFTITLSPIDNNMFARFVAAGVPEQYEWPDAEERDGASAAVRTRRQMARRGRNAQSITQLDVATRASLCSAPRSGNRSFSTLPQRPTSAQSLLPAARLRQSYSVQTLALRDAPARVRYDYRYSPSSLVSSESCSVKWRGAGSAPVLRLSTRGTAKAAAGQRAEVDVGIFPPRALVRHPRPATAKSLRPGKPTAAQWHGPMWFTSKAVRAGSPVPPAMPPWTPPTAHDEAGAGGQRSSPAKAANPAETEMAVEEPSDLVARAMESAKRSGEENYIALVRERSLLRRREVQ